MGLSEFAERFKSSWGAASAAATAGPGALLAVGFSPPWPSEDGAAAAAMATLAGIIGLVLAYSSPRAEPRRRTRWALGVAALSLIALAVSWSQLVVSIPQRDRGEMVERRYVAGLVMLERPKQLKETRRTAIRRRGLERTYSAGSLTGGRMAVLIPWLLAFGSLTYGFGLQLFRRR